MIFDIIRLLVCLGCLVMMFWCAMNHNYQEASFWGVVVLINKPSKEDE